ncbi:MAG: class I SAM-dependent methyltransferase [Vicinamibacteria bacterium]|nr:class I SAM-dependent methyltransferase [Vicinamibacteria bacterium]
MTDQERPLDDEALRQGLVDLHPWHMKVQVTPGLSTEWVMGLPKEQLPPCDHTPTRPSDSAPWFKAAMKALYPDGLEGKRVLDCACNCGGFCFWAKELGAAETFGFDAREHWIRQARFLKRHRPWASEGMRFEVLDLGEVPALGLRPFDITIFRGILYHLPDPWGGLKIAADLTDEVLVLGTATLWLFDPEPGQGLLIAGNENTASYLSGVAGPNWHPSGPKVLKQMLKALGFVETRILMDRRPPSPPDPLALADPKRWPEVRRKQKGRLTMIASKLAGRLAPLKDAEPSEFVPEE